MAEAPGPSEANADAPENLWIGQYDAQAMADALGMDWLQSVISAFQTRMVNIPALCSAPPPSAPGFTTLDLANMFSWGEAKVAAEQKMTDFVNGYTWSVYCHYTDETPPHLPPAEDPPAGVPPSNPMHAPDLVPEIFRYVKWMARNFNPLIYWERLEGTYTGAGQASFESDNTTEWRVFPMGVRIYVTEYPEYAGRSGGGEPPVMFDLGWVSIGTSGNFEPPQRLSRIRQLMHSRMEVSNFAWNLPEGVTIQVWSLIPCAMCGEGG